MCGSFALQVNKKGILKLDSDLKIDIELSSNTKFFPGGDVLTLINDKSRTLRYLKWGLIPFWAKDEKIGKNLFNARSETLLEKPSFKNAFKNKRALIFSNSYFEWKTIEGAKKKIPYEINLLNDEIFTFAALWDSWRASDGTNILSTTIITTEPNESIAEIHNRMPAIIDKKDWEEWLYGDVKNIQRFLKPYSAELIEVKHKSAA